MHASSAAVLAVTPHQSTCGRQTVDIKDFLSPDCVFADVRTSDKVALLQELAKRAAVPLNLQAGRISTALLTREELGSTGTGGGVAIPHARMAEVMKPFGMLARLAQPINFDAIDDQPVDIVFLLLLPNSSAGRQLSALASVARRLRDPVTLRQLHQATDGPTLYRAMTQ
jgi:PTS system nitrogen regulatory IIA component